MSRSRNYQLRRRVLELRLAGATYRQIAVAVGHPRNPGYVWRIAKQELREFTGKPAEQLRDLELERLDRLQLAAWPAAMDGDPKAALVVIKVMEHRARLLGLLDFKPEPSEVLQQAATNLGGVLVIRGTSPPAQKELPAPEPDE